ncbi:hypothetical protein EDD18DRAFT_1024290, partial [Armillaria luteobubalina]
RIVELNTPQEWRLFLTEHDEQVECEFKLHGVVCLSDLPPFKKKVKHNQIPYLHQSVAITGLGNKHFNTSIEAVAQIVAYFTREVGQHKLNKVKFVSMYQTFPVIHLSSHYFSRRDQVMPADEVDFDSDVDPMWILEKMKGQKYCHTTENMVYYQEHVEGEDGIRYPIIKASKIQLRDIIEVTMCFVAHPLAKGRVKLTAVLKTVTLVD